VTTAMLGTKCILTKKKPKMKNKTLTSNMPNVKWNALPPKKGPNYKGINYGNDKKNKKSNFKNLAKV
jgi:hypothetical protein